MGVSKHRLLPMLAAGALISGMIGATASASGGTPATKKKTNPLVGTWTRVNSCHAFVQAFTQAGLTRLIPDSLVGGGYFKQKSQIDAAHPCKGARQFKHSHFFTATGAFGSYDETGAQVDDGDYKIVAPNTLTFPSHEKDFGYKITVHYRISRKTLTTSVVVPRPCKGKCRGATAWAISAFYPKPFRRVK
jgi:hypothetical protein